MDFGRLINLLAGIAVIWIVLKLKNKKNNRDETRHESYDDGNRELGCNDSSEDN